MHASVLADVLGARGRGLDPGWPPVLVALVLVVLGAAAVSVIVFFRAARVEARGTRGRHKKRWTKKGWSKK